MHKSRIGCLVIDCKTQDLSDAVRFWSGALGCEADVDAKEPNYVTLRTPDGEPRILLQAVDHESRIHLDLETDDKNAESRRLQALGAREVGKVKGWIVMEAPSGHRFCLVGPRRAGFDENAKAWDGA